MKNRNFSTKQNKISLIIGFALILINALILILFGLYDFSFEEKSLSYFSVIISSALYLIYIIMCIFMRIKRLYILAKGIFIYQLLGALSFAIYFVFYILNINFTSVPYAIFHGWTLIFEPFTVLLARISGIAAKFITAVFYLLLTYITGKTATAIKKDIAYEKEYKENHPTT